MIYLMLSILCSAMLSIVMRLSEGKVKSKLAMLATNYVACFVLSWSFGGFQDLFPSVKGLAPTIGMGVFNGCFYMLALVIGQHCISKNGVILSSVFSKIGALAIPLIMSILIFAEVPTIYQFVGFLLAMISIVALNYRREGGKTGKLQWSLFLLFVTEGCAGIMAKVFREKGVMEMEYHFLLYTFLTAVVLCVIGIWFRREKVGRKEIIYGIMIGVPNFFASRFLLSALGIVPAVVVYPVKSVATIGVLALAGILLFHEKLRKIQWVAIITIVVALVLLSI